MASGESEKDYDILVKQDEAEMYFDRKLLQRYHKLTEFMERPRKSPNLPPEIRAKIEENFRQEIGKETVDHNIFVSQKTRQLVTFYEYPEGQLSQSEMLKLSTLFCTVYRYCAHEYRTYFIRHEEETESDQEAKRREAVFVENAYELVKRLKNLLAIREAGNENTSVTFNMHRQEDIGDGKMKDYIIKENQIVADDSRIIREMVDILFRDTLENLTHSPNRYIDTLFFQDERNLNLKSVTEKFENLESLRVPNGKQPSGKAVFKGYISQLVRKFLLEEELIAFTEYDYQAKILAYEIMAMYGLIDLELINSHTDRTSRAKYIDSLPKWTGEPILPANITIIPRGENT